MASELGFPQLDTSTYASQVFWLAVAFAILYILMKTLALPSVARVLEQRDDKKNGDLTTAEKAGAEAEKIRSAYEKSLIKAQKMAAETLAAAERAVNEKVSETQSRFAANARARMAAAEQDIARARAEALVSLADISADVAAEMVRKTSGITVDKAEARAAVADVMKG